MSLETSIVIPTLNGRDLLAQAPPLIGHLYKELRHLLPDYPSQSNIQFSA